MSRRLARAISILGHPLLTLPLAASALLAVRHPEHLRSAVIGFALVGAAVMGYCWRQVERARWAHVDASRPRERAALNRVLLAVLALSAGLAMLRGMPALALGLALAALPVVAALALSRWCTLSLHVAFAVYAAGALWWLSAYAAIAACAFAAAVAWSRLALARHRPRDLAVGAASGAAAAAAYLLAAQAAAFSGARA